MNDIATQEMGKNVVIDDVSGEKYEKIVAALGNHYLRHIDDDSTLEIPSLLTSVSWEQYEALLDALGDHYLRHTYDRGTLEIMSPSRDHEWIKKFIGRMIETMAYELDIPIQSVGSTTQRRKPAKRGLQPDESYYVAHEHLVRGRRKLDPKIDPPPDLVVEVDVSNSSLKRMPTYAALGVPEVWRHDLRQLTFNKLGKTGVYQPIRRSLAFPFLRPEDVARFVDELTEKDENAILREFVELANVLAARRKP